MDVNNVDQRRDVEEFLFLWVQEISNQICKSSIFSSQSTYVGVGFWIYVCGYLGCPAFLDKIAISAKYAAA